MNFFDLPDETRKAMREATELTLNISTGHVRKETSEWIERDMAPGNHQGFLAAAKWDVYGWFIYADADLPEEVPEDLRNLLALARRSDYTWVKLDCDAPLIPGLPSWGW